ncbi:hypothetical protein [Mucilaginibacter glaciei]|uniref:Uncharacterized protein n=1 Tax=Mucilaginibacter glaciei TaxID=2772109 RepID=A0A926NKF5_9SPHI|nr:hypothetical protein [Mucilaginibacter glaciei]MBD1393689.1 hypothetical protein [Mucilaginibacter glaciei]
MTIIIRSPAGGKMPPNSRYSDGPERLLENLISQQFRVTMAIMYYSKGTYKIGFDDFMGLVATSFKVEAGVAMSKTMMEGIAEKLLLAFGVRTAERLVPVVGAVIGGTANYMFVKRMAEKVKDLYPNPTVIPID